MEHPIIMLYRDLVICILGTVAVIVVIFLAVLSYVCYKKVKRVLDSAESVSISAKGIVADVRESIDTIKEEYTRLTIGGELQISYELMDDYIDMFLKIIENNKYPHMDSEKDVINHLKRNIIPLSKKQLSSAKEIQKEIFDHINKSKVKKKKEEPNKSDMKKTSKKDVALNTFFKVVSDYMDKDLLSDIKSSCSTYNSLTSIFKTKDIPAEVFKIKRVMDLYPDMNDKVKILKKAKLLKEDSTVTESRVLQDDTLINELEVENVNIQDVINF